MVSDGQALLARLQSAALDRFGDWFSNRVTSLSFRLTTRCPAPAHKEGHANSGENNFKQNPALPMLFHGVILSLFQDTGTRLESAVRSVLYAR